MSEQTPETPLCGDPWPHDPGITCTRPAEHSPGMLHRWISPTGPDGGYQEWE